MSRFYRSVPSESDSDVQYDVYYSYAHKFSHNQRDWSCTCPSYKYHDGLCKHIRHVRESNDVDPTTDRESFDDHADRIRSTDNPETS